jgi:hypothetical protein
MRPASDPLRDHLDAVRTLAPRPSDGRATRARVLVAIERRARLRRELRRAAGLLGVVLVLAGSASAAVAVLRSGWGRRPGLEVPGPGPSRIPSPPQALPAPSPGPRAATAEAVQAPGPPLHDVDDEAAAYGRAHELHFKQRAPERALVAWDAYLARYGQGSFAPEARYNRALCLVRLGRRRLAVQALRHFAEGVLGGYRRREACLLLDQLEAPLPRGCERPP